MLKVLENYGRWATRTLESAKLKNRRRRRKSETGSLAAESLEDRALLATFTVTSPTDDVDDDDDDDELTLREAVARANATVGLDTITFAASLSGSTIVLQNGHIEITQDLEIQGLGANQLVIDGGNTSRHFFIRETASMVTINDLHLTNGNGDAAVGRFGGGGSINTQAENLIINRSHFSNNETSQDGGAIDDDGGLSSFVTINASTFSDNESKLSAHPPTHRSEPLHVEST